MRHSNEPASLKARYRRTTGTQRRHHARMHQRFLVASVGRTLDIGRNKSKRANRRADIKARAEARRLRARR